MGGLLSSDSPPRNRHKTFVALLQQSDFSYRVFKRKCTAWILFQKFIVKCIEFFLPMFRFHFVPLFSCYHNSEHFGPCFAFSVLSLFRVTICFWALLSNSFPMFTFRENFSLSHSLIIFIAVFFFTLCVRLWLCLHFSFILRTVPVFFSCWYVFCVYSGTLVSFIILVVTFSIRLCNLLILFCPFSLSVVWSFQDLVCHPLCSLVWYFARNCSSAFL